MNRDNALWQFLDHVAASGQVPTREEIRKLDLHEDVTGTDATEWRRVVRQRAESIVRHKREGANQAARQLAANAAHELAWALNDRPKPAVDLDPLGPEEIAALIPRC